MIEFDKFFDYFEADSASRVFLIFPKIFNDDRGSFSEVYKTSDYENTLNWLHDSKWIKQINRSISKGGTIRGCHALVGSFCQGKLVEALTLKIYDIITDARPNSKTFGLTQTYVLDPIKQNKLWVPRGFLHSFVVPNDATNAIFQYFCDNVYDKKSEIGINPLTLLPIVVENVRKNNADSNMYDLYDVFDKSITLSEKDKNNLNYEEWMSEILKEYQDTQKLWYK